MTFKWSGDVWRLVVIMKGIFWMIRPPVESVKRKINHLYIPRTPLIQYALYSHEKFHKTNIRVQSLNCLHLSLGKREVEYLQQSQHISKYISCFFFRLYPACWIAAYKQTWKFSFMRIELKLFGMTTTPLCTLNLKATWAVVLLYFLATDTSSSSSKSGEHFRFTLWKWSVFYLGHTELHLKFSREQWVLYLLSLVTERLNEYAFLSHTRMHL